MNNLKQLELLFFEVLDYKERHLQMDRMYPVVLYKQGKIPLDFITSPKTDDKLLKKFVGGQISINKIDKFDFLLEKIEFL